MKKNFYITTTLPYVNATPHIGFASEIIIADVRARYERSKGNDVIFNTGTDEHGLKIFQKAQESAKGVQEYVDEYAKHFEDLKDLLNLSYTHFIRTTDERHVQAAKEFWKRVDANGYIYKKLYKIKYCVGCELEKTESELEDGKCPIHPNMSLEIIEEVNYFFKFSVFQEKLLALYERNPEFVVPKKRFNEIRAFVERGPEDFSISRRKEKMPWGVPVPGDDEHVMYVWFDALTNYISTLGWPNDEENFEKFWGTKKNPSAIQVAGKDNLRQQAAMWQAMLMAADLPTSKQIFINGFISVDGQKMSKSLGNVIRPQEMVEKFGVDGTRYLLLTKSNFGEDSDVSWGRLIEKYNADLANGLGNLVSRVLTLGKDIHKPAINSEIATIEEKVQRCAMKEALDDIWIVVDLANKKIESEKPWELKKNNPERFEEIIKELLVDLNTVARALGPFLPNTSERLINMLEMEEKEILFQRIK